MLIRLISKIDGIIVVIIFTVFIGVAVIAMRSQTYSVGYQLVVLKKKETHLRSQQHELQIELARMQKNIRDSLLSQTDVFGKPKYVLPEPNHVIREH